jgi:hypothetical protein
MMLSCHTGVTGDQQSGKRLCSIRCAYGDLEVVFPEDPVPDAVPQGTILVESCEARFPVRL